MGRKPILDAINDAHYSLQLVMYGLTDETLLNAILQQQSKGRAVKVILENAPYKMENENTKTIGELTAHHIDWQGTIPPFRLIHQKTLLIDKHKAIVMTFNFTHATFKKERNFALVIDNPETVREIESISSQTGITKQVRLTCRLLLLVQMIVAQRCWL